MLVLNPQGGRALDLDVDRSEINGLTTKERAFSTMVTVPDSSFGLQGVHVGEKLHLVPQLLQLLFQGRLEKQDWWRCGEERLQC